MNFLRRKLFKIFSYYSVALLFPIEFLYASSKKMINTNLSKEQKDIMFNEGTERAFTSSLLTEKRKKKVMVCNHQLINSISMSFDGYKFTIMAMIMIIFDFISKFT